MIASTPRMRFSFAAALLFALTPLVSPGEDHYRAWLQEYIPGVAFSQGTLAVAMDARGNVVVTGYARTADNNTDQFYTAKYDGLDGHKVWEVIPTGTGTGSAAAVGRAIAVDSKGDVVVTGNVKPNTEDFFIVKYNGQTGAEIWRKVLTGTGGPDRGLKIVVDSADNVIATGYSKGDNGNTTGLDFLTVKYQSNGTAVWSDRFHSTGNLDDVPAALAVDKDDNVIVAGASGATASTVNFCVRKLNRDGAAGLAVPAFTKILDLGGRGGARGVTTGSGGEIFATGIANVGSDQGFYTVRYSPTGTVAWGKFDGPFASNPAAAPVGITVGPDGHPVVAGNFLNGSGSKFIKTIKYYSDTGTKPDGTGGEAPIWTKLDFGPGLATDATVHQIVSDGAGNIIVAGETKPPLPKTGSGTGLDFYLAKYDADGLVTFQATYDGTRHNDDIGAGVAVDSGGNLAMTGVAFKEVNNAGYNSAVTIKYQRFIAESGDFPSDGPLPPASARYTLGNAPAVSDDGSVVARISLKSGTKTIGAILRQGPSGGTTLPVVRGAPAPNAIGVNEFTYGTLGDPVIAPGDPVTASAGAYAFTATLAGAPVGKTNAVFTNLSGGLKRVLQQGTPVPGVFADGAVHNLVSVTSISLRNNSLLALVKVVSAVNAAAKGTALINLSSANVGTVLLETGIDAPGVPAPAQAKIKTLTVLTAAPTSPGDGRWHGGSSDVARATLTNGTTVVYKLTVTGNVRTAALYSTQAADNVTAGATWKTFGLPGIGFDGSKHAVLGTLALKPGTVDATHDTAVLYSLLGASGYSAVAKESAPVPPIAGAFFNGFSDPVVNGNGFNDFVAFFATLKGPANVVTPATNRALFYTDLSTAVQKVARTGELAPAPVPRDPTELAETPTKYSAFVSVVLPPGDVSLPIFVAKLSGAGVSAKNNVGVFAVDSQGDIRRLLRTSQRLGDRTISGITLLKAVPKAFGSARSFNGTGAITAALTFTDHTNALVKLGIP